MIRNHSRRTFLQAVAAAPLLAAQTTGPHLQFPTEPRQRLAVTSYPFRAYIDSPTNPARDKSKPGMDLKEFPAMIAKRFGVHNINPVGDHLSSTDGAYLKAFRMAVEAAGSHMVDLGIAGQDFSNSGTEAVAFGSKWIDIAVLVGSPSIRPHLKTAAGAAPSVANAAESLARLAEYGSRKNIVVNLENDSPGSEDPFFITEVVGKVNSPYLRSLPDFGNSLRDTMRPITGRPWTPCLSTLTTCAMSKIFCGPKAAKYTGWISRNCLASRAPTLIAVTFQWISIPPRATPFKAPKTWYSRA